ncbi:vesicle-associated membrane protein 2-like [Tribolium madens]|uniref:vesicle-associated membrane protein 2-like n=1 Tax=Tribolium madens TaxID=41895 RepID=UPI001CF737BA|nr:vesicle-associated membrane protein 2-like [Tribolium madens]
MRTGSAHALDGSVTSRNINTVKINRGSCVRVLWPFLNKFHTENVSIDKSLSAGDSLGAPAGAPAAGGGDDGIVGGPRTPQQVAAQRRLQQTQAQVDEVVDIMKTNVEKVLERDQKLSELDDRADALQQGASQFEQQAGKLKRKFWLQNLKMMIIMGIIGLVILIIIIMKFMPDKEARL